MSITKDIVGIFNVHLKLTVNINSDLFDSASSEHFYITAAQPSYTFIDIAVNMQVGFVALNLLWKSCCSDTLKIKAKLFWEMQ